MAKVTFIGERDNDPEKIVVAKRKAAEEQDYFTLVLGEETDVPDWVAERVKNNTHFKVSK